VSVVLTDAAIAYRPREAAQVLGVSRAKLYELIAAGEIRPRKLGTATLVPRAELERFLDELPAYEPQGLQ
jgi:excisionase family DNA binding protein